MRTLRLVEGRGTPRFGAVPNRWGAGPVPLAADFGASAGPAGEVVGETGTSGRIAMGALPTSRARTPRSAGGGGLRSGQLAVGHARLASKATVTAPRSIRRARTLPAHGPGRSATDLEGASGVGGWGISATRRSISNSFLASGSNTNARVPSRHGVRRFQMTLPSSRNISRP